MLGDDFDEVEPPALIKKLDYPHRGLGSWDSEYFASPCHQHREKATISLNTPDTSHQHDLLARESSGAINPSLIHIICHHASQQILRC